MQGGGSDEHKGGWEWARARVSFGRSVRARMKKCCAGDNEDIDGGRSGCGACGSDASGARTVSTKARQGAEHG